MLARWSGWGAVPQVFDEHLDTYAAARTELRELLTKDGFDAASRTVLNAHYTDGALVAVMWQALQRLGLGDGDVLEPGCGAGHFIGMAPPGARMVGVERDPTSAGIAALLYPHARVVAGSFADLDADEGSFDAAVGNVPFGSFRVHDPRHNPARHSIHNHFLIKALHLTRPGGLVVALTSRYTLDARNPAARREMAELADLVGAVRLPTNAHRRAAGTAVVTDLLILRRREPDQPPSDLESWEFAVPHAIPNANKVDGPEANGADGDGAEASGTDTMMSVNQYFVEHPDHVLGEFRAKFVPDRGTDLEVLGDPDAAPALEAALERIIEQAHERGHILTPPTGPRTTRPAAETDLIDPDAALYAGFLAAKPDGTFTRRVGRDEQPYNPPPAQAEELRGLLGIRDLAMALITAENTTIDDTAEVRDLRAKLNGAYDTYVATYGPPSRYTQTRTMLAGWAVFKRWCTDNPTGIEHKSLPASPDAVRAYLTHLRDAGVGADILTKHLNGIDKAHQTAHAKLVEQVLDEIAHGHDATARERAGQVAKDYPDQFLVTTGTADLRLDPAADRVGREVIAAAEKETPDEVDLDELGLRTTTIKRPPQGGFRGDPFAGVVRSLEVFDPASDTARKEDILTQRVINPPRPRLGADTADEALSICLDTHSRVDLDEIARLLGLTDTATARAELGELVFDDPDADPDTGEVVWAPLYLSGNVRRKLARAREAAEVDGRFAVNVTALEQVVPADLGPSDVVVQLGAWVEPAYVQQFLRELVQDQKVRVERPLPSLWVVSGREFTYTATDVWGTGSVDAYELVESLLLGDTIEVFDEYEYTREDGGTGKRKVLNVEATEMARDKAAAIGDRFSAWVFEDPERAAALMRRYNDLFNSEIPTDFSTAELSTPGLAASITLREHQIAAVSRMIYQNGVGLIHDVGAGKTLEIIAGVMERRRRGLSTKTVIVVRNDAIAEQFERQWRSAYPGAQVLVATSDDFTVKKGVDKRAEFVARVITSSWDAIIITKDSFQRVPLSADTQRTFIERELEDIRALRKEKDGLSKTAAKKTEQALAAAEERLTDRLKNLTRDSAGVSFEQTGVDLVVVDEAQDFKNGLVVSRLPDLGIPGSDRAVDLDLKLLWLAERYQHSCAVLATATPFTGKFSEIYLWLRRLGHDLTAFDEWARNFIIADSYTEPTPSGQLRPKMRMRRMLNEDDLWAILRLTSDVKMADALNIPGLPQLREGGVEIIAVDAPVEAKIHSLELGRRDRAIRTNPRKPEKGADNHLVINHHGMQAALDLRIRGVSTDEPQKVDVIAEDIYAEHLAGADNVYRAADGSEHPVRGGLILAFCDESIPRPGWNFYQELKNQLVARGMREGSIRFIHEASTAQAKQDLFTACRAGGVSVLIGSTARMGAGLNVQDRLLGGYEIIPPRDYRADTSHQARGRVIRQGNQNEIVFWKRVVLAPSLDAKKWEIVRQKHNLFAPLLAAQKPGRHRDVDDDESIDLADVMAAATGDPRYTEKAELDAEFKKLTRLQAGHTRAHQAARLLVTDIEKRLPRWRGELEQAEQVATRHVSTRGAAFSMTVAGDTVTKRIDAAHHLNALLRKEMAATPRTPDGRDVTVAMLGGFTITAQLWPMKQQGTIHLLFADAGAYTYVTVDHRDLPESFGLITRLENMLDEIPKRPILLRSQIEDAETTLVQARTQIDAPFPHTTRLAVVAARRTELTAELSEEDDTALDAAVDPNSPEGKARAARLEKRAKERAELAEQVRLTIFEAGGDDPHTFSDWYVAIVEGLPAGQRPPVLTAHKVWRELGRPRTTTRTADPASGDTATGPAGNTGSDGTGSPAVKVAPELVWLAEAAMVSTVATRWPTIEDAVEHLRQVEPLPWYRNMGQAWESDHQTLVEEITTARKTLLSPSGALIAYKARSPHTGRQAWYVVHTASGAQIGDLITDKTFDTVSASRNAARAAITLPDAMMPRYLYALEHRIDTDGQRLDWTQDFAGLRTVLAGWAAPLPVDTVGRFRDADQPPESAGVRTLHALAVLDATAPDPLAAALTGELLRITRWVIPTITHSIAHTVGQRSMAPLRRALDAALSGRYPSDSGKDKALLAVDEDTSRVLTTTALWGFGADPHQALDLLTARIDTLHNQHTPQPTLPASRLRELVLHIAELHTPEPTELERLLHAGPGSHLIAAPPPDNSTAQPARTWEITGPSEPIDGTHGGPAARLPVTLHVEAGGTGDTGLVHGTLTVDPAAPHPVVIAYHRDQPDTANVRVPAPLHLPALAAGRWLVVDPDQPLPGAVEEIRHQSHRAAHAYLNQATEQPTGQVATDQAGDSPTADDPTADSTGTEPTSPPTASASPEQPPPSATSTPNAAAAPAPIVSGHRSDEIQLSDTPTAPREESERGRQETPRTEVPTPRPETAAQANSPQTEHGEPGSEQAESVPASDEGHSSITKQPAAAVAAGHLHHHPQLAGTVDSLTDEATGVLQNPILVTSTHDSDIAAHAAWVRTLTDVGPTTWGFVTRSARGLRTTGRLVDGQIVTIGTVLAGTELDALHAAGYRLGPDVPLPVHQLAHDVAAHLADTPGPVSADAQSGREGLEGAVAAHDHSQADLVDSQPAPTEAAPAEASPNEPSQTLAGQEGDATPSVGLPTLRGLRAMAAEYGLQVRVVLVADAVFVTVHEPAAPTPPVLSWPVDSPQAVDGAGRPLLVETVADHVAAYRSVVDPEWFAGKLGLRDWARRLAQLTPHLLPGPAQRPTIRQSLDEVVAAENREEVERLLRRTEDAAGPVTLTPEREAQVVREIHDHACGYAWTGEVGRYLIEPGHLNGTWQEWDWIDAYIAEHPEVLQGLPNHDAIRARNAAEQAEQAERGDALFRASYVAYRAEEFERVLDLLDQAELAHPGDLPRWSRARDIVTKAVTKAMTEAPAGETTEGTSRAQDEPGEAEEPTEPTPPPTDDTRAEQRTADTIQPQVSDAEDTEPASIGQRGRATPVDRASDPTRDEPAASDSAEASSSAASSAADLDVAPAAADTEGASSPQKPPVDTPAVHSERQGDLAGQQEQKTDQPARSVQRPNETTAGDTDAPAVEVIDSAADPAAGQEAAGAHQTTTLTVGDRVQSEYGTGEVIEHTRRSLTYRLDSGETLNVTVGTPGYYRVRKATMPDTNHEADQPVDGELTDTNTPEQPGQPAGVADTSGEPEVHSGARVLTLLFSHQHGVLLLGTDKTDDLGPRLRQERAGWKHSRRITGPNGESGAWYLPQTRKQNRTGDQLRDFHRRLDRRITNAARLLIDRGFTVALDLRDLPDQVIRDLQDWRRQVQPTPVERAESMAATARITARIDHNLARIGRLLHHVSDTDLAQAWTDFSAEHLHQRSQLHKHGRLERLAGRRRLLQAMLPEPTSTGDDIALRVIWTVLGNEQATSAVPYDLRDYFRGEGANEDVADVVGRIAGYAMALLARITDTDEFGRFLTATDAVAVVDGLGDIANTMVDLHRLERPENFPPRTLSSAVTQPPHAPMTLDEVVDVTGLPASRAEQAGSLFGAAHALASDESFSTGSAAAEAALVRQLRTGLIARDHAAEVLAGIGRRDPSVFGLDHTPLPVRVDQVTGEITEFWINAAGQVVLRGTTPADEPLVILADPQTHWNPDHTLDPSPDRPLQLVHNSTALLVPGQRSTTDTTATATSGTADGRPNEVRTDTNRTDNDRTDVGRDDPATTTIEPGAAESRVTANDERAADGETAPDPHTEAETDPAGEISEAASAQQVGNIPAIAAPEVAAGFGVTADHPAVRYVQESVVRVPHDPDPARAAADRRRVASEAIDLYVTTPRGVGAGWLLRAISGRAGAPESLIPRSVELRPAVEWLHWIRTLHQASAILHTAGGLDQFANRLVGVADLLATRITALATTPAAFIVGAGTAGIRLLPADHPAAPELAHQLDRARHSHRITDEQHDSRGPLELAIQVLDEPDLSPDELAERACYGTPHSLLRSWSTVTQLRDLAEVTETAGYTTRLAGRDVSAPALWRATADGVAARLTDQPRIEPTVLVEVPDTVATQPRELHPAETVTPVDRFLVKLGDGTAHAEDLTATRAAADTTTDVVTPVLADFDAADPGRVHRAATALAEGNRDEALLHLSWALVQHRATGRRGVREAWDVLYQLLWPQPGWDLQRVARRMITFVDDDPARLVGALVALVAAWRTRGETGDDFARLLTEPPVATIADQLEAVADHLAVNHHFTRPATPRIAMTQASLFDLDTDRTTNTTTGPKAGARPPRTTTTSPSPTPENAGQALATEPAENAATKPVPVVAEPGLEVDQERGREVFEAAVAEAHRSLAETAAAGGHKPDAWLHFSTMTCTDPRTGIDYSATQPEYQAVSQWWVQQATAALNDLGYRVDIRPNEGQGRYRKHQIEVDHAAKLIIADGAQPPDLNAFNLIEQVAALRTTTSNTPEQDAAQRAAVTHAADGASAHTTEPAADPQTSATDDAVPAENVATSAVDTEVDPAMDAVDTKSPTGAGGPNLSLDELYAGEGYPLVEGLTGVSALLAAHHWELVEEGQVEDVGAYTEHWRRHDVSLVVSITPEDRALTTLFIRHGPWESDAWEEIEAYSAQAVREVIKQAGLHGLAYPARLPGLWRVEGATLAVTAVNRADNKLFWLVTRPADTATKDATEHGNDDSWDGWVFAQDGTPVPLAPPLPQITVASREDVIKYVLGDRHRDKDLRRAVLVVLTGRTNKGLYLGDARRQLAAAEPEIYRRAVTAAVGRPPRKGGEFDVARARDALVRLAEGDPALPLNSIGQYVEITEPDLEAERVPLVGPMPTRLVRGVVVEVIPDLGTRLRVVIERDVTSVTGVPRALQDVPIDGVLTWLDPAERPSAEELRAAREAMLPAIREHEQQLGIHTVAETAAVRDAETINDEPGDQAPPETSQLPVEETGLTTGSPPATSDATSDAPPTGRDSTASARASGPDSATDTNASQASESAVSIRQPGTSDTDTHAGSGQAESTVDMDMASDSAGDMAAAALEWWDAGCSVVMVETDGSKRPLPHQWAPFQRERASREQVADWFAGGHPGVGIVTGAVSGGLEMFEFEGRAMDEVFYQKLRSRMRDLGHQDLWDRVMEGYDETSPSGGIHVLYRVEGGVDRNTKLAQREAHDGELTEDEQRDLRKTGRRARRVLIETRGEGGMVVVAPSHGPVHESGGAWSTITGDPSTIPTITAAERDILHMAARDLDQILAPPPIPEPAPRATQDAAGLRPGDDFNQRASWRQVLEPHGWVLVGGDSTRTFWRRPGKDRGVSAVTGGDRGDFLWVFSTSTALPSEQALSKWRTYGLLDHAGDFSAAARALAEAGYGDRVGRAQTGQRPSAPGREQLGRARTADGQHRDRPAPDTNDNNPTTTEPSTSDQASPVDAATSSPQPGPGSRIPQVLTIAAPPAPGDAATITSHGDIHTRSDLTLILRSYHNGYQSGWLPLTSLIDETSSGTGTGHQLHVATQSLAQVREATRRLWPVATAYGLGLDVALDLDTLADAAGAGVIVHLPRLDTLDRDTTAVVAALKGFRADPDPIPGTTPIADAVSHRRTSPTAFEEPPEPRESATTAAHADSPVPADGDTDDASGNEHVFAVAAGRAAHLLDRVDPATIQAATGLVTEEPMDRKGAMQALWAGIPIFDARLTLPVIEIVRDVVYGVTWREDLDPDRRARDAIAAGHGLPTATNLAAVAQELDRRSGGEDPLAAILQRTDSTEIVTQLYAIADRMAVTGEFVVPHRPNLLTRQESLFDLPEPGTVVSGTGEPSTGEPSPGEPGVVEPGAAVIGDTSRVNPPVPPTEPSPSPSTPRDSSDHDSTMVEGAAGEPNTGNTPAPVVLGHEPSADARSAIGDADDAPGDPINGAVHDATSGMAGGMVGDAVRPAESGEAPGDLVPLLGGEVWVTLARGPAFPGVLDEFEPLLTIDDDVPQDLFGQTRHPDVRVYFRRSVAEWIGLYFEAQFGGNQIRYEWRDDVLAIYDDPWDEDPDEQPRLIYPDNEGRYLIRQPWLALTAIQTAAAARHADALAVLAGNDPVQESEPVARYFADGPGREGVYDAVRELIREQSAESGGPASDEGVADTTRTDESAPAVDWVASAPEHTPLEQQRPEAALTADTPRPGGATAPEAAVTMPPGASRGPLSKPAERDRRTSRQSTPDAYAATLTPTAAADNDPAAPSSRQVSPSPVSPSALSPAVVSLRDRVSTSRVGWPSLLDAFLVATDPFAAQNLLREIVLTTQNDPHTQVLVAMAWRVHHGQVTDAEARVFADRLIQGDPSTVGHAVGRTIRDPRTRQLRAIHGVRADIEGRLFLHGTVADSTTTLTSPVDPDAWLNPHGQEILPAAEAFPVLQRWNELRALAAAHGYTVHEQPDTALLLQDERRIVIGADSLTELVDRLADITEQIVAIHGPTATSTAAAADTPAAGALPAPVAPAAPPVVGAGETQPPTPRRSTVAATTSSPEGPASRRDAIEGITVVPVDDPAAEPLADQLALRRHTGALLLDEPARLALTYVHRILLGPVEDAESLAQTVINVGFRGEAEQVAARLTTLADKIDVAGFTTPITGGTTALTVHLRAIARHVRARLTPDGATPPAPDISARSADTASTATADGRASGGQDNAGEPGTPLMVTPSADGMPHKPAAGQLTGTGPDVPNRQDPPLGTTATTRGGDRESLTGTNSGARTREETSRGGVPLDRSATSQGLDSPALSVGRLAEPSAANGLPGTVAPARTDSVRGPIPTAADANLWPTVDLDLPRPRHPADEPPQEPGRDLPVGRTAPTGPAPASAQTQRDRDDGTVNDTVNDMALVRPGEDSATAQWVRLVDRASHVGYTVVTAYDALSSVDDAHRVIRIDGNQEPLARVVDLAHKIGLLEATDAAARATGEAAHGHAPAATPEVRPVPRPPASHQPVTPGAATSPPGRRRVAAIPATHPAPSLPASMTPVFDALVRELGWQPTLDSGDSAQRAVAHRPAEPRPEPSPTPVFDQLMHELGWTHHLTPTPNGDTPADQVATNRVTRPPAPTPNRTSTGNGPPENHRPVATPARSHAHDEPAMTAGMAPGHRAHPTGGWGLETTGTTAGTTRGRNGR